jgi:hypothetical protein
VTPRVRLLLVAAACLALLGVAAVATRAPQTTNETQKASGPRDGRNLVAGSARDADDSALEDGSSLGATPGTSKPREQGAGRASGHGANDATVTTTTAGTTGGTTTTVRSDTSTVTTMKGHGGPKCPNPKTCDVYKLIDETSGGPHGGTKGWRADSDGVVRIRFYVNPTPPQNSGLTEETMEAAHLEATRIIEAANPRVKYVYQGRTTRVPRSLDGFNDFSFGGTAAVQHDGAGHIREADVSARQFVTTGDWTYTPCEQRDGGCGNSGSGKVEIMTTIVHEIAHTLGLADLVGDETSELTMDTEPDEPGVRASVTLGLGDVLGIRALYPTSAPMPPIYSP